MDTKQSNIVLAVIVCQLKSVCEWVGSVSEKDIDKVCV